MYDHLFPVSLNFKRHKGVTGSPISAEIFLTFLQQCNKFDNP